MLLVFCAPAIAHKPSDSYLSITVADGRVEGQWDIALRDLEFAVGLDANGDGNITWGELSARHADVASYALARLKVAAHGGICTLQAEDHLVDQHSDGAYAVLKFTATCPDPGDRLTIGYTLFFDLDPTHRGLARIESGGLTQTAIFSPERREQTFDLAASSLWRQMLAYAREGVWHIWIGFDHVLFLLALLLPAVWQRVAHQWRPAPHFMPAFWEVFKVVTAFTVAHSITLSLAALGLVALPSRLVESVIAASVLLAALNNLFPVVSAGRWMMAFGFGLIHGFGFASVLTDLGLPRGSLVTSLFGFNLGVELGQLAIVAAFLPLAYALRATWLYARVVFIGGSVAVSILATAWLLERALNIRLLS
ncbi:MAG: HupE/UreJ family protein [Burkholderiales bacterium]|nr:HupE/UreJ family protein [Burkholderiales bacterium]